MVYLPAVAFNAETVIRNGHAGASLDDDVFCVLPLEVCLQPALHAQSHISLTL